MDTRTSHEVIEGKTTLSIQCMIANIYTEAYFKNAFNPQTLEINIKKDHTYILVPSHIKDKNTEDDTYEIETDDITRI